MEYFYFNSKKDLIKYVNDLIEEHKLEYIYIFSDPMDLFLFSGTVEQFKKGEGDGWDERAYPNTIEYEVYYGIKDKTLDMNITSHRRSGICSFWDEHKI